MKVRRGTEYARSPTCPQVDSAEVATLRANKK